MKKLEAVKFSIYIVTACILILLSHVSVLHIKKLPLFENYILQAYIINAFVAVTSIWLLFWFRIKLRDQLGFLVLGISLFKFLLFFLIFQPVYRLDGNITRLEFFTFFTPYITCLFLITLLGSRILNKLE